MKFEQFPEKIRPCLLPKPHGHMVYRCLGCKAEFDGNQLLYTCPDCGSVLMLHNKNMQNIKEVGGEKWRQIFDYRRMLNHKSLKGIFRYYEFIAPIIPLDHIIYLGEAHTPMVEANARLKQKVGLDFYFKNDGLNPSASFKDRGMACALSYINYVAKKEKINNLLAICASTGDTSASAALYASYLEDFLKSAVLLPKGKVTPQQLSQPLGSGAKVLEIPGVFDDCMQVVESLAENYNVALLNSKNSWRILGQESFSFEIAQDFDYDMGKKSVVFPSVPKANTSHHAVQIKQFGSGTRRPDNKSIFFFNMKGGFFPLPSVLMGNKWPLEGQTRWSGSGHRSWSSIRSFSKFPYAGLFIRTVIISCFL